MEHILYKRFFKSLIKINKKLKMYTFIILFFGYFKYDLYYLKKF